MGRIVDLIFEKCVREACSMTVEWIEYTTTDARVTVKVVVALGRTPAKAVSNPLWQATAC